MMFLSGFHCLGGLRCFLWSYYALRIQSGCISRLKHQNISDKYFFSRFPRWPPFRHPLKLRGGLLELLLLSTLLRTQKKGELESIVLHSAACNNNIRGLLQQKRRNLTWPISSPIPTGGGHARPFSPEEGRLWFGWNNNTFQVHSWRCWWVGFPFSCRCQMSVVWWAVIIIISKSALLLFKYSPRISRPPPLDADGYPSHVIWAQSAEEEECSRDEPSNQCTCVLYLRGYLQLLFHPVPLLCRGRRREGGGG